MSAETETIVRPCCSMCLIVPDDPAAIEKRLVHVDYWLCTDRTACLDRATAQQHEAAEAVRRAVAAEKAALEAGDVNPDPEGKHATPQPGRCAGTIPPAGPVSDEDACTKCLGITTDWRVPATGDDGLCDSCRADATPEAEATS